MNFPVEVSQLSKFFALKTAVYQLSFRVARGQTLGFLGPNGAGKTTIMKMLTGYLRPSQGTIRINGYPINEYPRRAKKEIGYLPEHNPLYGAMYVDEYLQFMGNIRGLRRREYAARAQKVVESCGIAEMRNKKLHTLSKGYRQRVGLAQALIHDPAVLILDEPTTGLDPNQLSEIRALIKEISGDKAVIVSTHIMQEIEALCDLVLLIDQGKMVIHDELAQIQPSNALIVEFKQPISITLLEKIEGVQRVSALSEYQYVLDPKQGLDIREAIFCFAQKNALTLLTLERKKKSLEAIFKQLTTFKSPASAGGLPKAC